MAKEKEQEQVIHRNRYTQFKRKRFNTGKERVTERSHAKDCDINTIMSRYKQYGTLPTLIKTNPQYGDFSDTKSYQESLEIVQKAKEQFQGLSAQVRARFENDPAQFLEFAGNKNNKEEMAQMGLLKDSPKQDKTQSEGENKGAKPVTA